MTTDGLATAMATRARSAARAARYRRKTRHTSARTLRIANTRIDERVEDVDDEVRHHDSDATDDEDREHDGIVTLDDRAERQAAHARPREHHLRHHRAGEHRPKIHAEYRQDGSRRVSKCVAIEHPGFC